MRCLARLACLLAVALAACERDRTLEITKTRIARLPITWRRPSINVADDGAHVTFAVRVKGGYQVVTPAGRGLTYKDVSSPLFAPKSDRVFYWGSRDSGGRERWDVVAHGTVVPTPFVERGDLVTSRGGTRWAARGPIDEASGARRIAIMVDGREMGRHEAASRPTFTRDGAHVAWLALDGGRGTIVVDGTPARSFETAPPAGDGPRVDELTVTEYLADGRLLALLPDAGGWALHRGDEVLGRFELNLGQKSPLLFAGPQTGPTIFRDLIALAEDAAAVVWWERMPGAEERWRVMRDGAAVDGMECSRYWETQAPVLSADGTHVAYVCPGRQEPEFPLGRRWVVLDGRRFGPYAETWTLGLADDGGQVAYGASETLPVIAWRVFANGTPRTSPQELVWRPRVSPDGTSVLWAGGPERGRRWLGIDRRLVTRFDDTLYGPEFPEPNTAVSVIRRRRSITRLEVRF